MSAPTGNTRNTPPGPSLNAPQFNGVNPQVHPQPAVAQIEADPLTMGEPVNMHVGLPSLHLASPSLANESELSLSQQFDVAIGRAKAAVSGDPGQFIRLFVEVAAIHEAMDKTSRRSGGHEVAAKTAAGKRCTNCFKHGLAKTPRRSIQMTRSGFGRPAMTWKFTRIPYARFSTSPRRQRRECSRSTREQRRIREQQSAAKSSISHSRPPHRDARMYFATGRQASDFMSRDASYLTDYRRSQNALSTLSPLNTRTGVMAELAIVQGQLNEIKRQSIGYPPNFPAFLEEVGKTERLLSGPPLLLLDLLAGLDEKLQTSRDLPDRDKDILKRILRQLKIENMNLSTSCGRRWRTLLTLSWQTKVGLLAT